MKYQTVAEIPQQLDQPPPRSSWDSAIDGRITRGDVLVGFLAMLLLSLSGLFVGVGFGLLFRRISDGAVTGVALGMALGGIVVGIRTIADVARIERKPQPELVEQTPPPEMGVPVEVIQRTSDKTATALYATLLPDVARRVTEKMFKKAAIAIRQGARFSKRGAGRFFGDRYGEVQSELERLGLLVPAGKSPNAGYELTPEGKEWLDGFLAPDDAL